jgi:hypothetical protein
VIRQDNAAAVAPGSKALVQAMSTVPHDGTGFGPGVARQELVLVALVESTFCSACSADALSFGSGGLRPDAAASIRQDLEDGVVLPMP